MYALGAYADVPYAGLPLAFAATGGVTLAGSALAVAGASGALSQPTRLAGSANTIATATAAITQAVRLVGSAAGLATASGALSQPVRLAGDALALVTASGTMGGGGVTLAGDALAVATAAGVLSQPARLAGAAATIATATGAILKPARLAGNAAVVATATGAITTLIRLAGAATVTATATATVTIGAVTGPSTPPVFLLAPQRRTFTLTAQRRTITLPGKRKSMTPFKLPDKAAPADYTHKLDFSAWEWIVNGDTIASATTVVIAGDVQAAVVATTTNSVTVRFTGGTKDTMAQVSVQCTLLSGEKLVQTVLLDIIP